MSDFDTAAPPVTLLYVPAHKPRAIEKARGLGADMVILDMEAAVPDDQKDEAREAVRAALVTGMGGARVAVRVNSGAMLADDMAAVRAGKCDFVVLPRVQRAEDIDTVAEQGKPVLAMIEMPGAVLRADGIAGHDAVAGLLGGWNDLAYEMKIPAGDDREALSLARKTVVLAARAHGKWCFDGVYNEIDDEAGFEEDARDAYDLGYDGKSLLHPSQVEPCRRAWLPSEEAIERAERMVAAASGGAQRFEGRMIEAVHIEAAKALLARAELFRGHDT